MNYHRTEPAPGADGRPSPGRGIADEKPLAVANVSVSWPLPRGATLKAVRFITPEEAEPRELATRIESGRVRFSVPTFLVYGVARIELQ